MDDMQAVVGAGGVDATTGFSPRARRRSAGRPAPTGIRRALTVLAAVGTTLAAVVAVAATVLLSMAGGASYLSQARTAIRPVIEANGHLAAAVDSLSARGGAGAATATAAALAAVSAVQTAELRLGTLVPGSTDQGLAHGASAAMTSELVWLEAAISVLENPRSPMLSQLGALGADARAKLTAIDRQVPGAAASFPASSKVIRGARHELARAGASAKSALIQFGGQVQTLLDESAPGTQEMNDLVGQVGARGRGALHISLPQAEAVIATVVANHTALAASARALAASTPLASEVRGALATALAARVTDDQAIDACLSGRARGRFAVVMAGCLTSTASEATAATDARQRFLALDNQLRRQIGEPAITPQF